RWAWETSSSATNHRRCAEVNPRMSKESKELPPHGGNDQLATQVATTVVCVTGGGVTGGVGGAGTAAAVGFLVLGPPGAAVGFLFGLVAGTAGGLFAGKKVADRINR